MKKLDAVGRFSICDDRGNLCLRWWDRAARCTRSKRLQATNLTAARREAKAIIRTIAEPLELIAPERRITKDPTFGEVWISYERQKEATLSKERFDLLKNRLDIYYRPNIWNEPMSNMSVALHRFVLLLQRTEYSRLRGKACAAATPEDRRKLHPNTISDIVRPVIEVCALARKMDLTEIAAPDMPEIAGRTAPADRPKNADTSPSTRSPHCRTQPNASICATCWSPRSAPVPALGRCATSRGPMFTPISVSST